MSLLQVNDIHTYYGHIHALKGISLTVEQGEIVTLIGANGAGKTTTIRTISGLLHPRSGVVLLNDEQINGMPAHQIVTKGIGQSPEGRQIFTRLTVQENLEMGAYSRSDKDGVKKDLDHVFQLFPRLAERRTQAGGTLSGGEQQMLAMGRALMTRPRVLMLDEPSMGLAPVLVDTIFEIIKTLNQEGTTILLVEQNAARALSVANRGYVLETGRIMLEGNAQELAANEQIRKLYLGEE
ncbi:MAG: High-affinity branched-chain amino acid transport ATP-binding protein LivF [Anaerolineae bacterium]|nr:High-affinity branched-chain amino acid transport ATP-binding protein LivF [Anaerolineae bacterium]RIK34311.1 MAG: ABC transporter ATP-binding protein [Chloroflexota bacterium]